MGNFEKLRELQENDPEQFLELIKRVNRTTLKPHAGQQLVLDSTARFKVMNCGRRWGKTVLAANIITKKARQKGQMLWWIAPTYRVVKRGYAEVLRQLPPGVLAKDAPPESNFDAGRPAILHFKNGTKMEFYSAERPEGMLGAAVDFAVLDEAALMPTAIWNQIVSPTLIDHEGGALMISTPRGRNWFYDVWRKGQDPQESLYDSWTFTTQDNPTLPLGEADRMAADMPRLEADQEIFAKWLAAGSSVFILEHTAIQHARVFENGVVEGQEEVSGGVFLGVDLARTNDYTVLYGEVEKTRLNCYYERWNGVAWPEQRRRIMRAARRLLKNGAEYVTLMVDEGNAGSVIVEDLNEMGMDVHGVNFTTHKAPMVRLLANDLELGKAFILDSDVIEFENYAMNMTPSGRLTYSAPAGQHDDVVSAKMLAHWGVVNLGFGDFTVTRLTGDQSDDTEADYDEDDFADLLDDDDLDFDLSLEEQIEEARQAGYREPSRMTPNELAARGWF